MSGSSAAERRLLPEGRLAGPMPWVIAIMMFLTALAAAAGLALARSAAELGEGVERQITVQVALGEPAERDRQARAAEAALRRQPGVSAVRMVAATEMQALLRPWLGDLGAAADLPIPAMIDARLDRAARDRLGAIADAVRAAAPAARVDDHGRWVGPLLALMRSLLLLAGGIVALMAGATAAAVVLAARAALDTHRGTIEVMHVMGATDVQVARLFQRRIALDALFGGLVGLGAAVLVILLIGGQVEAVGEGIAGALALAPRDWAAVALLPLGAGTVAFVVARITVLRALGRTL